MAEGFVALRDRARELLAQHDMVDEDLLLAYVYGARCPPALRSQLAAPLLGDPRFTRSDDGQWMLASRHAPTMPLTTVAFTALAMATTGSDPARHRVVAVTLIQFVDGAPVGRFDATFNPGRRVPRYVAARSRIATEDLDADPAFASTFDELLGFLETRPIVAQEARLARAFLDGEARRLGRALPDLLHLDVNTLAARFLMGEQSKPTLALVAERLGIGFSHIGQPREEARVVGLAASRLLTLAAEAGVTRLAELAALPDAAPLPLRSRSTTTAVPETPGVYFLVDAAGQVVYVGKARNLRSRLEAYVHRPLGLTRRLEGLAEAVAAVEWTACDTDLEALIVEGRAISTFAPRFNTQRIVRRGPTWLSLPPEPESQRRARPRLELTAEPAPGNPSLGPFRNTLLAREARDLARQVFELDELRRHGSVDAYRAALADAWAFLGGDSQVAANAARAGLTRASARRDHAAVRHWERLLAGTLAYDPSVLMLPADPRTSRFAVVRPGASSGSVEVLVIDRGAFVGSATYRPDVDPIDTLCELKAPRATAADVEIVLHWLGSQRPPARLVHLTEHPEEHIDQIARELLAQIEGEAC